MKRLVHIALAAVLALSPAATPLLTASAALAGAAFLTACTTAQLERAEARLKRFSQKFTDFAQQRLANLPGAGSLVADIIENNRKIQEAEDFKSVGREYLSAFVDTGEKLIEVAKFAPIPSSVLTAAETVLKVIKAALGLIPEPEPIKAEAAAATIAPAK